MTSNRVPRVSWSEFLRTFDWRQGEHISLVGPTGCGKTTLGLALLERRKYVTVFGTKPRDDVLDRLARSRTWRRRDRWLPRPGEQRIILWPRFDSPDDVAEQKIVFTEALKEIFVSGGWCVFVDEARYLCDFLHLEGLLRLYWQQGRSLGLSLVATTQRPANMPLELYNQATHLFLWRETDRVNLIRLGGIAGAVDSTIIKQEVATLPGHEFLYLNTRTGAMIRSRVEGRR